MAYLPGALPCFEDFGCLPTDIVGGDGLVQGRKASEILDMLIIPGGSLVESQSLKTNLVQEILQMADDGKFLLGVCSGLQILSKATDIGRLASEPILRSGLGLLDAEFKPLVCTDRVSATVVGESFMTKTIGTTVMGFHCHTYGKLQVHDRARAILVSHIQRANYKKDPQDLVSGVANNDGNIVGVLIHALLDRNEAILENIANSLDISEAQLKAIRKENKKLKSQMKREVGVSTYIHAPHSLEKKSIEAQIVLITAIGSGAGKTVIVTGLAGALKKMGLNVGVVKVGGDIRDLVPALYLVKEPIQDYSSIQIGESGWTPFKQALEDASKNHDFVLVEGAMNAFTGLFSEKAPPPTSTAEVALALDLPTVIVVASDKEGVEGAFVNAFSYAKLMNRLGIRVKGVIFNKARIGYLSANMQTQITQAFGALGIVVLGLVPRIELEGRGLIPEIEIRYEEFGSKAVEVIENSVDLKTFVSLGEPLRKTGTGKIEFLERFMKAIASNSETKERGKGRV